MMCVKSDFARLKMIWFIYLCKSGFVCVNENDFDCRFV